MSFVWSEVGEDADDVSDALDWNEADSPSIPAHDTVDNFYSRMDQELNDVKSQVDGQLAKLVQSNERDIRRLDTKVRQLKAYDMSSHYSHLSGDSERASAGSQTSRLSLQRKRQTQQMIRKNPSDLSYGIITSTSTVTERRGNLSSRFSGPAPYTLSMSDTNSILDDSPSVSAVCGETLDSPHLSRVPNRDMWQSDSLYGINEEDDNGDRIELKKSPTEDAELLLVESSGTDSFPEDENSDDCPQDSVHEIITVSKYETEYDDPSHALSNTEASAHQNQDSMDPTVGILESNVSFYRTVVSDTQRRLDGLRMNRPSSVPQEYASPHELQTNMTKLSDPPGFQTLPARGSNLREREDTIVSRHSIDTADLRHSSPTILLSRSGDTDQAHSKSTNHQKHLLTIGDTRLPNAVTTTTSAKADKERSLRIQPSAESFGIPHRSSSMDSAQVFDSFYNRDPTKLAASSSESTRTRPPLGLPAARHTNVSQKKKGTLQKPTPERGYVAIDRPIISNRPPRATPVQSRARQSAATSNFTSKSSSHPKNMMPGLSASDSAASSAIIFDGPELDLDSPIIGKDAPEEVLLLETFVSTDDVSEAAKLMPGASSEAYSRSVREIQRDDPSGTRLSRVDSSIDPRPDAPTTRSVQKQLPVVRARDLVMVQSRRILNAFEATRGHEVAIDPSVCSPKLQFHSTNGDGNASKGIPAQVMARNVVPSSIVATAVNDPPEGIVDGQHDTSTRDQSIYKNIVYAREESPSSPPRNISHLSSKFRVPPAIQTVTPSVVACPVSKRVSGNEERESEPNEASVDRPYIQNSPNYGRAIQKKLNDPEMFVEAPENNQSKVKAAANQRTRKDPATEANSPFPAEQTRNMLIYDPYGDRGLYTGQLVRGRPHGHGTMNYADSRMYVGEWKHGRWHGSGRAVFANGDSYVGDYFMDQRHGFGRYQWADNRVYDGEFSRDQRHGSGTYSWPDGSSYVGEFVTGQRSGQGVYTFVDGSTYCGGWKGGKYDGRGDCRWADGRTYNGEWVQGHANGYGTETRADGTIRHQGYWKDDRPVRSPVRVARE